MESYFWGVVDLIAEDLLHQASELSLKGSHDRLCSSLLAQLVDLDYRDQLVELDFASTNLHLHECVVGSLVLTA